MMIFLNKLWSKHYYMQSVIRIVQTLNYAKRNFSDFFGVILISGYHSLPSEQDYWSNSADSGVKVVSESLSRKHFMQIYSIFHLVDNRELKIIQTKWQSRSNLRYPQQCTYTVQDFPHLFECG